MPMPPFMEKRVVAVPASALPSVFPPPNVPDGVAPLTDYLLDAWQRSVLFLDALRERGNETYLHEKAGMPPVLAFDYEVVADGRELEDPANYALLRIVPKEGGQTNPRMRPFVVIDPRAGHGPGIAGFKMDSEIGVALRKGHPCYFVTFFPLPCDTQRIQSVARAEAVFLRRVRELHPDADGLPFVIGNCQGGWAAALLAASAPELVGPLMLAGSPLSYWAGVRGKNPMRYSGGMLGGSWAASFASDLGDGHFDGAHLVQNFEYLNPANTLWGKLYTLYSKVDTERERFLEFERWWGGHFQLNRAEIDWIVQNLFVGNQLTRNEVYAPGARAPIDLRNIRTPIILLASWGDNITPPQQALNWIPDLYSSVDEIVANEQVIVYCLHEKAGHLGIFVSSSVANREHTELFSALDLIDVLPPGLYEAVITDRKPEAGRLEALEGRYEIRFERRTIDDVLALDDGRADEQPFEVVRRYSAINQRLYDLFVSPFVRASSNALSAHALREMQPSRVERSVFSDANPALAVLPALADTVRTHRKPVEPDNPFAILEKQMSAAIESALDSYRDARDAWVESAFYGVYGAPWVQALVGVKPDVPLNPTAPPLMQLRKELAALRLKSAHANLEKGTAVDAFMRIVAYLVDEMHTVQYRPFQKMRDLAQQYLGDRQPSIAELKEAARRQGFIVHLDPQAAIDALPELVPDVPTRRALLAAVYRVCTASQPLDGERRERFREVARVLGVESGSVERGLASNEAPKLDASAVSPVAALPDRSDGRDGDGDGDADRAHAPDENSKPAAEQASAPGTRSASPAKASAKHVAKPAAKARAAAGAKPAAAAKPARRARSAAGTPARAAASPSARRRVSRTSGE
jgi:pimeloyl-ACP methyl ester carboxylesterase